MRTGMYFATVSAALLSSVDAASLRSFPAFDADLAEIAADNDWNEETFAQYDLAPILMDDAYFAETYASIDAFSSSEIEGEWGIK